MRDLMRDVMVRNTRALVDVRLPPRHAVTQRTDPAPEEQACYQMLASLVRAWAAAGSGRHRLALHHLTSAAGSSPAAAAAAIRRFADRHQAGATWQELHQRYRAVGTGGKEAALLELLNRNPTEKKLVFVHNRDTLAHLQTLLSTRGVTFASFDGGLTGLEKDAAIADFRDRVGVLLCSESGGEGRNIQFCNTLINFDLPWNPMAIEQRIGRIHRIGQRREVFIFNLVAPGTLEDQVLRILDEKINMFELVVGEVGEILGALEDEGDFSEAVFDAWLTATDRTVESAFTELGRRLENAKDRYEAVKQLDNELFGEEFEAT